MIGLYTWATPNGRKISIALEELGLPYEIQPVNIHAYEQFTAEFLKLNPNNKIPVIQDSDGPDGKPITLFESGAILIYLAEKTGSLVPTASAARYETLQWLMFQTGGVGPMFGQTHHFRHKASEQAYSLERYTRETHRLYGVLDARLARSEFVAGDDYSIADIAIYPWVARFELHQLDWRTVPHVKLWYEKLSLRCSAAWRCLRHEHAEGARTCQRPTCKK